MTRVVLVRQNVPHYEINHSHPIGLMSLAAFLHERGGYQVTILDNRLHKWPLNKLLDATLTAKPDVVGMTALSMEATTGVAFSDILRKKRPEVFQVFGGSHASVFTRELLAETTVDAAVVGEGEIAFANLLTAWNGDRDFARVKGVAYRKDGIPEINPPEDPIADMDALPFPAWDSIDVKAYFGKRMGDLMYSRPQQMTMFTSRGCPYACIFCHNIFGKKYRGRSPGKVLEELHILVERYGIREVQIQDDVFNFDMDRAKEIFRGIIADRLDLVISFPNGIRADRLDDELIDLMARSGVRRLAFGVETTSPPVQKSIHKNLDLQIIEETVRKTVARGILTKGYFMLGFPDETEEDMRRTIEFASRIPFHTVGFSRVIPFQGTRMYALLNEKGVVPELSYNHYRYDYSEINVSGVSDETLERMFRDAYWKGYVLTPGRLFRLFRVFPNKRLVFPYYFGLLLLRLFARKHARRFRK